MSDSPTKRVVDQMKFYFSKANLAKRKWLRRELEKVGWVDSSALATRFGRLSRLLVATKGNVPEGTELETAIAPHLEDLGDLITVDKLEGDGKWRWSAANGVGPVENVEEVRSRTVFLGNLGKWAQKAGLDRDQQLDAVWKWVMNVLDGGIEYVKIAGEVGFVQLDCLERAQGFLASVQEKKLKLGRGVTVKLAQSRSEKAKKIKSKKAAARWSMEVDENGAGCCVRLTGGGLFDPPGDLEHHPSRLVNWKRKILKALHHHFHAVAYVDVAYGYVSEQRGGGGSGGDGSGVIVRMVNASDGAELASSSGLWWKGTHAEILSAKETEEYMIAVGKRSVEENEMDEGGGEGGDEAPLAVIGGDGGGEVRVKDDGAIGKKRKAGGSRAARRARRAAALAGGGGVVEGHGGGGEGAAGEGKGRGKGALTVAVIGGGRAPFKEKPQRTVFDHSSDSDSGEPRKKRSKN